MKLFASESEVAAVTARLGDAVHGAGLSAQGAPDLDSLVALAWHLRQRDSARALTLVQQARLALASVAETPTEPARLSVWLGRADLVQAEVHALRAELDAAFALAQSAQAHFTRCADAVGLGDVHWLKAAIFNERGRRDEGRQELADASALYREAGDVQRVALCAARGLFNDAFKAPAAVLPGLRQRFPDESGVDAAVMVWVHSAYAVVAGTTDDPGGGIVRFLQAWHAARETGQIRQGIVSVLNAVELFVLLGDLDAALQWSEQATALARHTGWPSMVGASLQQAGSALLRLGRLEEASQMLNEAYRITQPLAASRNQQVTLGKLGELALAQGDPARALDWYQRFEQVGLNLAEPSIEMSALLGQGHALAGLGEVQSAMGRVARAYRLAMEHDKVDEQLSALRLWAQLHRDHVLPAPPGMTAPNAVVHYLEQCLAVAANIKGYRVAPDLLEDLAKAHALAGDFQRAYQLATQATRALEQVRSEEATQRAIALRVQFETESALSESAHHKQLALTQQERAQVLLQTNTTLEVLGRIGREITACLDAQAVYASLYRHVNELLDATSFDIYMLEEGGRALLGAFSMEDGKPYALDRIPFEDVLSYSVRCAMERQELAVNLEPGIEDVNTIPGTLTTLSLFFTPLLVGQRLLGVMSIQSVQPHAYGEREHAIFRTLCAYGAIALDNAAAYAQAGRDRDRADLALASLRETQERLVLSEKMAALGALVAGVAHELNTPLGNGLMAISTLRSELQAFRQGLAKGGLKRREFDALLETMDTGSALALRGVARGLELVARFKQLASDRSTTERSVFSVKAVVLQALAFVPGELLQGGHQVQVDIADTLTLDSYPEVFVRVVEQLLCNALKHGFEGRSEGLVRVTAATHSAGWLTVCVVDNGCGISAADLPRVFDPFFTTRFGQGGSGLGLHIAHNQVSQVLGGRLTAHSEPGHGTEFVLTVPLEAPGAG